MLCRRRRPRPRACGSWGCRPRRAARARPRARWPAHPAGQHRLAGGREGRGHGLRDGLGVAAGLGRVDRAARRRPAAVLQRRPQRGAASAGRGVFAQVDQPSSRRGGDLGSAAAAGSPSRPVQADLVGPVGRQHARPAAVGDDGQRLAHRPVARGQALRGREQLRELRARAPRRRGAARRRRRRRCRRWRRVRERRLRARRAAAGLHHHHRLGIGRRAQRAHEAARVRMPSM
jgi:hypothetical protein